ncbi:hypothetical protein KDX30_03930 [Pseudomonas sp. CDFA 553]|uniref:hypothetical protein n=1 Tax=Pseudomonas quasicaspiana TaxID=2829821 RepID=UPI001E4BFCEA|nr:hypothetical protein [Pseudomonas quasicaspiana]MCD5987048.1 hypothetical protein [Pseudomonas quasicaspiana]
MPTTHRRELNVSLHPLKLIACIAIGIWLGFVAVAMTGMLIYKALPAAETQVINNAAAQLSAPPVEKPAPAAEKTMFEKYEQSLRESEARQAWEQAQEQQQKNFNGPKCNFWMQQDRTAPSEKSRANVIQFCG